MLHELAKLVGKLEESLARGIDSIKRALVEHSMAQQTSIPSAQQKKD